MRWLKFSCGILAAFVLAGAAQAQPVGVGTTKGGAVAQMGAIISKVVSANSDIQMRTQVMGGSQQYIDVINAGQLEFGMVSNMQMAMNLEGTEVAKGRKRPNLRVVATMVPFRAGILVPRDSGIKKIADLKGKRVVGGYTAAPVLQAFMDGMFANGGLAWSEVTRVPVAGLRQGIAQIKSGKADGGAAAVGAGHVKELNLAVNSGVRFVSLDPSPEAVKRMHKYVPRTRATLVQPNPKLAGIDGPTYVLGYDYMLVTHKDAPEALIEKVVKTLAEHEADIKASSPIWRSYSTKRMSLDHDLPYHPGAITYYKQAGIWNR